MKCNEQVARNTESQNGVSTAAGDTNSECNIHRRRLLQVLAGLGIGNATWRRAVAQQVDQSGEVSPEMVADAEWIAGIELSESERESTARALPRSLADFAPLRAVEIDYDMPPCLSFSAAPWMSQASGVQRNQARPLESHAPQRPASDESLAFLPVTELSALFKSRQVSATELTQLYSRD